MFENIFAQREFRETTIIEKIKEIGFDLKNLSAVVSRGGLTKPIAGGVYTVDDTMINDLAPKHASSITVVVAYEIAKSILGTM